MFGTTLNVTGVVIGGMAGLALRRSPSLANQQFFKMALGVFTVWVGLKISVTSLHGNFWQIGKQMLILMLALILGHLLGRVLRVQKGLNHLGQVAKDKLASAQAGARPQNEGFLAATILFCAAPLAVLGPIQDGLAQDFQPLLLKAVMDGLVAMALVLPFGWTVILGALPMAAVQVTLTRAVQGIEPLLRTYSLTDSVHTVCGLLIFCVALIIFQIKKIDLGDYLPALALAPLLTWMCR